MQRSYNRVIIDEISDAQEDARLPLRLTYTRYPRFIDIQERTSDAAGGSHPERNARISTNSTTRHTRRPRNIPRKPTAVFTSRMKLSGEKRAGAL